MQQTLDLPNPDDWLDGTQAAEIIGTARTFLYSLVERGALGDYKIGKVRVYWRAEVVEYARARKIVAGRG